MAVALEILDEWHKDWPGMPCGATKTRWTKMAVALEILDVWHKDWLVMPCGATKTRVE